MDWQYNTYTIPLLIAAAVSSAVALFAWRRRPAPAAAPLTAAMMTVVFWAMAYALELASIDLAAKIMWAKVQYLGIVCVAVSWLVFALAYSEKEGWLTPLIKALLAVAPPATLAMVFTNETHSLIWRDVALDASNSVPVLLFSYGDGFWVLTGFSYLLLLASTVLLVKGTMRSPQLYRGQATVLLVGVMVPWVGHALRISGLSPFRHLDLTPFAFTVSGLASALGLFRFRLLDILPVARDAVVEGMIDGMIVLDTRDRIVDINPAAQQAAHREGSEIIGQPIDVILPMWTDLAEQCEEMMESRSEIVLGEGEAARWFDLRISPLHDRRGRFSGRLGILRDVSQRKRAEEALQYRVEFEELIITLSANFIDQTADKVDTGINQALQAIGRFAAVDRSYVFLLSEDEKRLDGTHEWCAEGIASRTHNSQGLPSDAMLWLLERLDELDEIHIPCVDDLPPEAETEKRILQSQSVQSLVVVPMTYAGALVGFVGFDSVQCKKHWSDDAVTLLGIVGDIFVNALVRKGGEEKLRKARDELETRVKERTSELDSANKAMRKEVVERRRAEGEILRLLQRAQEQADQVQQIISTVPEGMVLLDGEARILLANPLSRKYLSLLANADVGDRLTHLGGRPVQDLLVPPPRGLPHEVRANTPDRRWVFELLAQPMKANPGPRGWVLVLRDVTDEQEFQQAVERQERLAAVGQMAAGVAHDFNNIMTAIVLYSQLMSNGPSLTAKERKQLATIRQQGLRATDLIQQILDFSRQSVMERQSFNLLPLVKELEKLMVRTFPASVRLEVCYDDEGYTVNADPTRMQQVIMNLALNARDAMSNEGHLLIRLRRLELVPDVYPPCPGMTPGDWAHIAVSDTGTGISPEVLPHIFEPFFTTKPLGQGTGLGLAQVYGIVREHGGHIDVQTKVGQGSTFSIYLPVAPVSATETYLSEIYSPIQGRGETILVVEDDAPTRDAVRDSLEMLNYRVLEAANGLEALAVYGSAAKVDLVLTDMVMPEMGGKELIEELTRDIPPAKMVAMTGYVLAEDIQALGKELSIEVLRKPLNVNSLSRVISQTLDVDRHTEKHASRQGALNG